MEDDQSACSYVALTTRQGLAVRSTRLGHGERSADRSSSADPTKLYTNLMMAL